MRILENSVTFEAKLDVKGAKYNHPKWRKASKFFEKKTQNLDSVYDIRIWETDNSKMKFPIHEIIIEALPIKEQKTISRDIPNIKIQIADMKEWKNCAPQGVTIFMAQTHKEIAEKLIKFAAFARELVNEYIKMFPESLNKSDRNYYTRGNERANWYSNKVNNFLRTNFKEEDAISTTEVGCIAPWAEILK